MPESDDDEDDDDLDYAREEARWRRSQGGGPRRRQRSECCGGDCFASCSDFLQLLICECGLNERLGQPTRRFASSPLDGPVDIIFMWVNGSDPQHVRSYASAQERGLLSYRPHASRFRDEGIFEYVLRSAMACSTLMSQTRHVYLVTAGEMPTRLPEWQTWLPAALQLPKGAWPSFTREIISAPLAPLIEASRHNRPPTPSEPMVPSGNGSAGGGGGGGGGGGDSAGRQARGKAERRAHSRRRLGSDGGGTGGGGTKSQAAATAAAAADEGGRRFFVVPHRALLDEEKELPTFNSNAINAVLHRIPGSAAWSK